MNVNPNRVAGVDQADSIKALARQRIGDVRANESLSGIGRRDAIKDIYDDAQRDLAALRAEVERVPRQRRDLLESVLFGGTASASGADAISTRDAYLRATQIKEHDEAAQLMEAAKLSGDSVLAKAVAQVAVKHSWTDVLEAHAAGDSYMEDRYSELLQINHELADTGTETMRLAADMERQLVFNLEQPDELSAPATAVVA